MTQIRQKSKQASILDSKITITERMSHNEGNDKANSRSNKNHQRDETSNDDKDESNTKGKQESKIEIDSGNDSDNSNSNNDNTMTGGKRKHCNDCQNENENENGPCMKKMRGNVAASTKDWIMDKMRQYKRNVSTCVCAFDQLLAKNNQFNKDLNVLNEILSENEDLDVTASTLEFIVSLLRWSKYATTIWQHFNEKNEFVKQYSRIMETMYGNDSNDENSNEMNNSNNESSNINLYQNGKTVQITIAPYTPLNVFNEHNSRNNEKIENNMNNNGSEIKIRLLFNRRDSGESKDIVKEYECRPVIDDNTNWQELKFFCNPLGDVEADRLVLCPAFDDTEAELEQMFKKDDFSLLWQDSEWEEYFDSEDAALQKWDDFLEDSDNRIFLVRTGFQIWLTGKALANMAMWIYHVDSQVGVNLIEQTLIDAAMIANDNDNDHDGKILGITRLDKNQASSPSVTSSIEDCTFCDPPTFILDKFDSNSSKRYYYGKYYFVKNVTVYEIFDDIVFMHKIKCYCDDYKNMKSISWYIDKYNIHFHHQSKIVNENDTQLSVMKPNSIQHPSNDGNGKKLIDILRDVDNVESKMTLNELNEFRFDKDSGDLTVLMDITNGLKTVSKADILKVYQGNISVPYPHIADKTLVSVIGISLFDVPSLDSFPGETCKDVMGVLNVFSNDSQFNDGIDTYNFTVIYDIGIDEESGRIEINRKHVDPRSDRRMNANEIMSYANLISQFATANKFDSHLVFITSHGGVDSNGDEYFYSSDDCKIYKDKIRQVLKFNGCSYYMELINCCNVSKKIDEQSARDTLYNYRGHDFDEKENKNENWNEHVRKKENDDKAKSKPDMTSKHLKENIYRDENGLIKSMFEYRISCARFTSAQMSPQIGSPAIYTFVSIIKYLNDYSRLDVRAICSLYEYAIKELCIEMQIKMYHPAIATNTERAIVFPGRYYPNAIHNNNKNNNKNKNKNENKNFLVAESSNENKNNPQPLDTAIYNIIAKVKHQIGIKYSNVNL